MEKAKPFIYIDTNFNPAEAMMLDMAFRSFDYEILGISTSSGLMSPKAAAENIVGLSAAYELYMSVAAGEKLKMDYQDKEIFTTRDDYIEEMAAFESIIDKADDCGRLDIITTGPLTNLARALDEEPAIEDFISHIFILGGSLGGGISENFKADPEAINKVLNTGIDIFILPDEVADEMVLTDERLANFYGKSDELDKILDEFKAVNPAERSLKAPLILYLTQVPEAFIFEEAGLAVDTKEEAGALRRVDSRKKNYLANKVNEDSFFDFLEGSL